jgi:hypothetical protein
MPPPGMPPPGYRPGMPPPGERPERAGWRAVLGPATATLVCVCVHRRAVRLSICVLIGAQQALANQVPADGSVN